jgi:hypothetical protein
MQWHQASYKMVRLSSCILFALGLFKTTRVPVFQGLVQGASSRYRSGQPQRIVIAVSTLFDGKGNVLKDRRIVIEGSKIVRLDPNAGPIDYEPALKTHVCRAVLGPSDFERGARKKL